MRFIPLLSSLTSRAAKTAANRRKDPPIRKSQPALEYLEDRCLLSSLAGVNPNAGPAPGTIVQVYGSGFQSGTQVFFDNVLASPSGSQSATMLTVVVPSLADGPADVKVVDPDGTQAVLSSAFYAMADDPAPTAPAPVITAPSPKSGSARPALGILVVNTGNAAGGTNTILIGVPVAGAAAPVTAGLIVLSEGNAASNIIKLDNSSFNQASLTAAQASSSDTIEVLNNLVKTAAGLSVSAGLGGNAVHLVTIGNNSFTGGGPLSIDIGDGVTYWDDSGTLIDANASKLIMSNDTGIGAANISVGKFFQTVTVGTDPAAPVAADSLNLAIGADPGIITLNDLIAASENITVGTQVDPLAPAWTFSQAGSIGGNETVNAGLGPVAGAGFASLSDSASVGGNQSVAIGDGTGTVNVPATVAGTKTVTVGNGTGAINISNGAGAPASLTLSVGNGHTVNLASGATGALTIKPNGTANDVTVNVGSSTGTQTVGSLSVTLGTNATVLVQNVTSTGASSTTGDISVAVGDTPNSVAVIGSNAANDLNITAGNGKASPDSSLFYVFGDTANNNLNINTGAAGNAVLSLLNSLILNQLAVNLGGGINTVFAQAVSALFGNIDGGGGPSSIYLDLGGNLGFTQSGFAGF